MEVDDTVRQIKIPPINSLAEIAQKLLDDFFSALKFDHWLLGSVCIIGVFLVVSNYWKEPVFFPFFSQDKNGSIVYHLEGSQSTISKTYNAVIGVNRFTFNDLLKIFILFLIPFMFFKTVWNVLGGRIIRFLSGIFKYGVICLSWMSKISIDLLLFLFPSIKKRFVRWLEKFPKKYSISKWIADPQSTGFKNIKGQEIYPQLRLQIPLIVKNFQHLRFKANLIYSVGHWRIGVFITSPDKSQDFVFHLYKDENDNRILSKMTKRIFSKGHRQQSDKELNNFMMLDTSRVYFELLQVSKNLYALKINGTEIDRYKVPAAKFKFIDFGAWADDRPYKVEFSEVEFLG